MHFYRDNFAGGILSQGNLSRKYRVYIVLLFKVAGRPILMRFITFKVAVLFQQWTSVLTSSSMQFVCLSIGIDYSKF